MCQRCENCNWYVAGIVSFGHECGQTHGVYTSVPLYESWVRQVINAPRVTAKERILTTKTIHLNFKK